MEKIIIAKALNRQYNALNTIACFKKQIRTNKFIEQHSSANGIPMDLVMVSPEVFDHIEHTGAIYHYIQE